MTSYVTYDSSGVSNVIPVSTPVHDSHADSVKNLRDAMRDAGITQTEYRDVDDSTLTVRSFTWASGQLQTGSYEFPTLEQAELYAQALVVAGYEKVNIYARSGELVTTKQASVSKSYA
jgi:hypothetical protein